MDEVNVKPTASRSVRYHVEDDASSDKSPIYWIFRATLRDGSMFAIDPCNAQYSFTTAEERNSGVFPWDYCIDRLSLTGDPGVVHELGFHAPDKKAYPVGNIEDGQRDIFVDADIRSTSESMASGALAVGCTTLSSKTQLSLSGIMASTSNQTKHKEDISLFKKHLQDVMPHMRTTEKDGVNGIKYVLMQRLHQKG
jgi:hypothetical protein